MMKKLPFVFVGLALVIRVLSIFIFADTANPEMWEFGKIARNLLAGNGFQYTAISIDVPSAYMPPGLPFLYFLFFKVFGDVKSTYFLILILNSLLASVNVIIIYKIAGIVYDSKTALLSAAYSAISPIFIFSSVNFNSIIIYQLLIGLSFLLVLNLQSLEHNANSKPYGSKLRNVLFLSLTLGLFLYFRSEIFGLILVLAIYFLRRKRRLDAVILLITAVLIISPWTIRNFVTLGKFVPVSTSIGYNFYTGHGDEYSTINFNKRVSMLKEDSTFETEKSKIGFEEAYKYIKDHPLEEAKESVIKVISLWFIDKYRENARSPLYLLTWVPTLLFFFIGFVKSMKDTNIRNKLFFMNLYLIFSTILVVVFFNIPRYQIQMSFIMIPTAMFGLKNSFRYFSAKLKSST